MLLLPPPNGKLCVPPANAYVQPSACSTVNCCPATVSVATRAGPWLGRALKYMSPLPLPVPRVTVIHGTVFVVPQGQPLSVFTRIWASPPAEPTPICVDERA